MPHSPLPGSASSSSPTSNELPTASTGQPEEASSSPIPTEQPTPTNGVPEEAPRSLLSLSSLFSSSIALPSPVPTQTESTDRLLSNLPTWVWVTGGAVLGVLLVVIGVLAFFIKRLRDKEAQASFQRVDDLDEVEDLEEKRLGFSLLDVEEDKY